MVVDSKEKQLSVDEILNVVAEETQSPYPPDVLRSFFVRELQQPGTKTMRYGNTMYVIHPGNTQKNKGTFRALNADTAENYMESGKSFVKDAYSQGFDSLVTEFRDQSILNIFRNVSKNPPQEGMGYEASQTEDGEFEVVLQLGTPRQGMAQ
jgi:hypothetical protein